MKIEEGMDPRYVQGCLNILTDLGGFDAVEGELIETGHVVLTFHASCAMRNPAGDLHGGFYMAVADMAACMASSAVGRKPVTLQSNFNFCKGIHINGQKVTVDARVVRGGNTIQVIEVVFTDEAGDVCLTSSFTTFAKGSITDDNHLFDPEGSLEVARGYFKEAGREVI